MIPCVPIIKLYEFCNFFGDHLEFCGDHLEFGLRMKFYHRIEARNGILVPKKTTKVDIALLCVAVKNIL